MADNERSMTLTPAPYYGAVVDDQGNDFVGGETFPRLHIDGSAGHALTTQTMRLTYFTAKFTSPPITKIITYTGTTAAAATPTIARVGLYTIAVNGNGTLVASCANDTAMWSATATEYAATIASPAVYVLQPGQRYAAAVLVVTAVAAPTLLGAAASSGTLLARPPQVSAALAAQSDLPASFTAGSLTTNSVPLYVAFSAS